MCVRYIFSLTQRSWFPTCVKIACGKIGSLFQHNCNVQKEIDSIRPSTTRLIQHWRYTKTHFRIEPRLDKKQRKFQLSVSPVYACFRMGLEFSSPRIMTSFNTLIHGVSGCWLAEPVVIVRVWWCCANFV